MFQPEGGAIVRSHHLALGSVATGHLLAAGVTTYAGVPPAAPIALALVGLAALALAVTGPRQRAERRPPAERRRLGRLVSTGRVPDRRV